MDKKEFDKFRGRMNRKNIQTVYFDKNCLDLANKTGLIKDLVPTLYKGQESKNSLSFKNKPALRKYFDKIEKEFEKEMCDRRITTIHSSALLAFLAFYKVSKNAPIKIFGIDYTQRFFEVKNVCIDPRHPSQVDVVLVSSDWKNVLYLESKFTEPLEEVSSKIEVRGAYRVDEYGSKIYGDCCFFKDLGLQLEPSGNNFNIVAREGIYLDGIKQMISHYIGIRKGSNGNNEKDFEDNIGNAKNIFLASIVYDFTDIDEKLNDRVCTYGKLYNSLAEKLNKIPNDKNVHVLENLLTYQDVFSNENNKKLLSKTVKDLYKIGK